MDGGVAKSGLRLPSHKWVIARSNRAPSTAYPLSSAWLERLLYTQRVGSSNLSGGTMPVWWNWNTRSA